MNHGLVNICLRETNETSRCVLMFIKITNILRKKSTCDLNCNHHTTKAR
jgi:hypothetical protein